jgi:DNA-binding transcriptional LysR family regulator
MNRDVDLRHLRYFLAVCDTLHFGKAAEMLGMAQPPLSQQIRNLERNLGYSLFDRTTRGVKLTRVGRFLEQRARLTLARVADDVEMARRLGSGQEGILAVGFSGSTMFTALPHAIEQYRRMNPKVDLRLRELGTGVQIPALLNGTLDLGFLRDGESREGLTLQPVLREPYVAVLPANHKLRRKPVISPAELKDEAFIFFSREMGALAYDRTVACCEAVGFRPRFVQDAPQWPTVLRLVAAGMGVSLAPACVTSLAMPGVVFKKLRSKHRTSVDIGMKAKPDNPAALPFLKIAARYFSNHPDPPARAMDYSLSGKNG